MPTAENLLRHAFIAAVEGAVQVSNPFSGLAGIVVCSCAARVWLGVGLGDVTGLAEVAGLGYVTGLGEVTGLAARVVVGVGIGSGDPGRNGRATPTESAMPCPDALPPAPLAPADDVPELAR